MTATSKQEVPYSTTPQFLSEARQIAVDMMQYSAKELGRMLGINPKLAAANYLRFQDFLSEDSDTLPALLSYTGMVFKRISPKDFSASDWDYAQRRLLITSFMYGLLRPLDRIKNYRMEGNIRIPEKGGVTMFDYWKPILTDFFIETIKREGNILVNLASAEMKSLFDWERVERETEVFTPEFRVMKNGKPTTVTIYAKMCRGEMTRFILKNRIEDAEALKAFSWEGFRFDEKASTDHRFVFTL